MHAASRPALALAFQGARAAPTAEEEAEKEKDARKGRRGGGQVRIGGVNHESAHTYNIPIPKIGLSWFWEVIGTFNPGNPLKAPLTINPKIIPITKYRIPITRKVAFTTALAYETKKNRIV